MSFKYNYAIMRSVPDSLITKGKAKNLNLEFLRREQQNLAEVLDKCGVRVVTLETDTNYPECCFVEDCAVIVGETALICRPADQSRRGEVGIIKKTLEKCLELKVFDLKDPTALIDGGDVLFTGKEIFVGIGQNTNEAGAIAVANLFEDYSVISLSLPGSLHLKNLISMAGKGVIVIGNSSESKHLFQQIKEKTSCQYYKIEFDSDVPANMLYVNGRLIHRTRDEIGAANCSILDEKIMYTRHEVDLHENDKLNRTLSSMCLLVGRNKFQRQLISDITEDDINNYSTLTRKPKSDYYYK